MTKAPYSVLSFFPSPPSFLGASSAFEVAMWKSLATNLNKYNNRVISSVTDALLFFFFSPRCRGGAVFCERRAWSRASLPLPFPGPFLFVDLHVFYGRPPPPFSPSFMRWWFCFPSRPMMKPQESPGPCDESQQLLGDKERGVRWGLGVFGGEWA